MFNLIPIENIFSKIVLLELFSSSSNSTTNPPLKFTKPLRIIRQPVELSQPDLVQIISIEVHVFS